MLPNIKNWLEVYRANGRAKQANSDYKTIVKARRYRDYLNGGNSIAGDNPSTRGIDLFASQKAYSDYPNVVKRINNRYQ